MQDVIGAAIGGREAGRGLRGRPALSDRRASARRRARGSRGAEEPARAAAVLPESGERRQSCSNRWQASRSREGPNQISPRERQAPRRRHRQRARARHRLAGRRGARRRSEQVQASTGLLDHLGRAVREPRRGAPAPDDRGARLLLPDLPPALLGAREPARCRCSCSAPCRWR